MVQIKNPIFSTQKEYLLSGLKTAPSIYYPQMQFELFVTKRELNYFYSYHPHLPSVQIEVYPDLEMFNKFEEALIIAIDIVEKELEKINNLWRK